MLSAHLNLPGGESISVVRGGGVQVQRPSGRVAPPDNVIGLDEV